MRKKTEKKEKLTKEGDGPMALPNLKINHIEKRVSIDHTRPCIQTYNKNKKIHVRITSTVKVIRTCIFIE